jgi:hypothetical protein
MTESQFSSLIFAFDVYPIAIFFVKRMPAIQDQNKKEVFFLTTCEIGLGYRSSSTKSGKV